MYEDFKDMVSLYQMDKNKDHKSALNIQKGIDPPAKVNKEAVRKLKSRKKGVLSADEYVQGVLAGDRAILGKAITLVESSRPEHQELAQEIIDKCLKVQGSRFKTQGLKLKVQDRDTDSVAPSTEHRASSIQHPASLSLRGVQQRSNSIRIGITGVPGVGKSTFIETLGKHITGNGHKLAVLAVDPSSTITRGSILGDKTRMEELSVDPNAFIRPSPSAGSLGGVARKTRETIILCEAAGFDVIFVETVGVGQSETAVKSMVDFFLLLMLAGAGDELQGIKRGIIEMADAIIINKADGDNLRKAKVAAMQYSSALHLFPPSGSGWTPVVDICSATTGAGIPETWNIIETFRKIMIQNGHFLQTRLEQNKRILHQAIEEGLQERFYKNTSVQKKIRKLEQQIINGTKNPYQAAAELLNSKSQVPTFK